MTTSTVPTGERADLLETLQRHGDFLLQTVRGLSDEQARLTPTASQLCLGGLVKHVSRTQANWLDFIEHGPGAMAPATDIDWQDPDDARLQEFANGFRLLPSETLSGVLADYQEVRRRTVELVTGIDLDLSHPLPAAPWFAPGAVWSARRVLIHIVAETSQHAGHADIIRETIDGQRTMG